MEPTIDSWFQKILARSVVPSGPVVHPQVTSVPPRAMLLMHAMCTALPTLSATMSTPRPPVALRTSRDQSAPTSSTQ